MMLALAIHVMLMLSAIQVLLTDHLHAHALPVIKDWTVLKILTNANKDHHASMMVYA